MAKARSPLARVRVLLVSPKSPGNVGSAARAVKNMGIGRLDIVEPRHDRDPAFFAEESRRLAAGSLDVLKRVRAFDSLELAVRPSAYLVATSARSGRDAPATTPREAAPRLVEIARNREVAILFGPEHHGLPNRLVRRANECLRIPAASRHPVLNLAQAVMLVGYELQLASRDAPESMRESSEIAPAVDHDALHREGLEALALIDFLKPHNRDRVAADLATLLARATPDRRELSLLRGVARQIRWLAGLAGRGAP